MGAGEPGVALVAKGEVVSAAPALDIFEALGIPPSGELEGTFDDEPPTALLQLAGGVDELLPPAARRSQLQRFRQSCRQTSTSCTNVALIRTAPNPSRRDTRRWIAELLRKLCFAIV